MTPSPWLHFSPQVPLHLIILCVFPTTYVGQNHCNKNEKFFQLFFFVLFGVLNVYPWTHLKTLTKSPKKSQSKKMVLISIFTSTPALWCEGMVPLGVSAIVIHKMVALNPSHGRILLSCQPGPERRGRDRVAPSGRIGGATTRLEISVPCHKWLVPIVGFIFSIFCGP